MSNSKAPPPHAQGACHSLRSGKQIPASPSGDACNTPTGDKTWANEDTHSHSNRLVDLLPTATELHPGAWSSKFQAQKLREKKQGRKRSHLGGKVPPIHISCGVRELSRPYSSGGSGMRAEKAGSPGHFQFRSSLSHLDLGTLTTP